MSPLRQEHLDALLSEVLGEVQPGTTDERAEIRPSAEATFVVSHCQNHNIAPFNHQSFCTQICEERFQKQEAKIIEQTETIKKLEEKLKKQEKKAEHQQSPTSIK